MSEHYRHVFKYGRAEDANDQRWAFRFSITDPTNTHRSGRRPSLCTAFCSALKVGEVVHTFRTAREAAIECDIWKFYLSRFHAVTNLLWSFETFDAFSSAYSAAHNGASAQSILHPGAELKKFIDANEDVWEQFLSVQPANLFNPDIELHRAIQSVEQIESLPAISSDERTRRHMILAWAKRYKDHSKLCRQVEAYGVAKLECEAKMNVDMLEKTWRYAAGWPRPNPKTTDLRFSKYLEKLAGARQEIKALAEKMRALQLEVETFTRGLPLTTEEMKQERVKL
jgi:hypothetical protein